MVQSSRTRTAYAKSPLPILSPHGAATTAPLDAPGATQNTGHSGRLRRKQATFLEHPGVATRIGRGFPCPRRRQEDMLLEDPGEGTKIGRSLPFPLRRQQDILLEDPGEPKKMAVVPPFHGFGKRKSGGWVWVGPSSQRRSGSSVYCCASPVGEV